MGGLSQARDVIRAMRDTFINSPKLSYVKSVTMFSYWYEIEEKGLFPYINLDLTEIQTAAADNMNLRHMERRTFPVFIMFGVRAQKIEKVKEGDDDFKGLFDMHEDIRDVIYEDRTFGNVINSVPWLPEFSSIVERYRKDDFWVGRAVLNFKAYKDVTLV